MSSQAGTTEVEVPECITPKTIDEMDDALLLALLDRIAIDRMKAQQIYEQTQRDLREKEEDKAKEKLVKANSMLEKAIAQLDKVKENLEKRITTVQRLRIDAGLSLVHPEPEFKD